MTRNKGDEDEMDTLFRLVNLQQYYNYQQDHQLHQQQSNSFPISHSTPLASLPSPPPLATTTLPPPLLPLPTKRRVVQECFNNNSFMDEDDFISSSSSKHPADFYHPQQQQQTFDQTVPFDFSKPEWAASNLLNVAHAISAGNSHRLNHLMWVLNEVASSYGDCDQKLASYFLPAIFSRMTDSDRRSLRSLSSASDRSSSFDSTRKLLLKFQEVSPWTAT